jgi:RNA polymerase sigma factor (sigma-70 family)
MKTAQELPLTSILATLAMERGDQGAWAQLYERTWTYAFRVNSCVLRRADIAEDATQEVFVRLIRYCAFSQFSNEKAFLAYLGQVCRNVSRSLNTRSRRRGETSLSQLMETEPMIVAVSPYLEAHMECEQMREIVVGQLATPDRSILELWLRGNTIPEIASIEGISYGNVAVRLHRLRRKLKTKKINNLAGRGKIVVKTSASREFLQVWTLNATRPEV